MYGKSLEVLYRLCLEQAGCRVDSAPDNDAAMRLYREHGPYDVVLTHIFDYRDLSKRIRERNPEQAIAIVGACSAMSVRLHHKVQRGGVGKTRWQHAELALSFFAPRKSNKSIAERSVN